MNAHYPYNSKMISRRKIIGSGAAFIAGSILFPKIVAARAALITKVSEKQVHFYHIHTGETFKGVFWANGRFIPEAVHDLNHLLRDWRTNKKILINHSLFDLLYSLKNSLDAKKPFEIICGYRDPKTNEGLRQARSGIAKHSRHLTGDAIDFRIPGVRLQDLRKAALLKKAGGVGYYPQSGFIHVDIRDKLASW